MINGMVCKNLYLKGTSMYMTPLYAYIPLLYPKTVEKKIAIAEICMALGFMIGIH